MKKLTLALGVVAFLSTAIIAGPNSSGAYVGLGYGTTNYESDDFVSGVDTTDSGFKVYGGYQFNNIIAVEAAYTDYGDFKLPAINKTYVAPTSFSVAANVGYSFLDSQLRPYGMLGLGYLPLNTTDYFIKEAGEDKQATLHYGVGIQYEPNLFKGVGFRLGYEADIYSIEIINPALEDKTYTQAFSLLYLGVQYKF